MKNYLFKFTYNFAKSALALVLLIWIVVFSVLMYEVFAPIPKGIGTLDTYLSYTLPKGKVPVVYDDSYNISFYGAENVHPFDTRKYEKVFKYLEQANLISYESVIRPVFPSMEVLSKVHTSAYLASMKDTVQVSRITEVPLLSVLPSNLVYRNFVVPQLYASAGTMHATKIALDKGWAINIGGGFHHAHKEDASGFCLFSDIALSVLMARETESVNKIMIIDLDAHQGNGHGRDFGADENVYIFDMYNAIIFPNDYEGYIGLDKNVHVKVRSGDEVYLDKLAKSLKEAFNEFKPDLIIYNAGTDILEGDPLGMLNVSPKGVMARDEMVFTYARKQAIPIVMLLSGGYQENNAKVIAGSIINLANKSLAF